MRIDKHAVVALAGAAALFAGGASALAGNGAKGSERCDELLAKVAEKHGVSPEQLKAEVQARLLARIDAAEKAGKISAEQAARRRQRVSERSLCRADTRVRVHLAARGMLRAAAEYLGLDRTRLRAQLPGNSLAGLAQKQGKSVDALKAAMVDPATTRLAQAVAQGRISQAQADAALARLQELAGKLAERVFPARK